MTMSPAIHGPASSGLARLLLAIVFLAGSLVVDAALGAGALAAPTRAAETDLTLMTSAHYDVQPAQHRVRVVVDVTASNRKRDTVTKRCFFR